MPCLWLRRSLGLEYVAERVVEVEKEMVLNMLL